MRMRDFERGTDVVAQCDRPMKRAVPAYSRTYILIFQHWISPIPTVNKVMVPLQRLEPICGGGGPVRVVALVLGSHRVRRCHCYFIQWEPG